MSEFGEKINNGEMPMYMTTAGMPVGPTLNEHLQRKIKDTFFIGEGEILTTRSIKRFKAGRVRTPYIRDLVTFQHLQDIEPPLNSVDS